MCIGKEVESWTCRATWTPARPCRSELAELRCRTVNQSPRAPRRRCSGRAWSASPLTSRSGRAAAVMSRTCRRRTSRSSTTAITRRSPIFAPSRRRSAWRCSSTSAAAWTSPRSAAAARENVRAPCSSAGCSRARPGRPLRVRQGAARVAAARAGARQHPRAARRRASAVRRDVALRRDRRDRPRASRATAARGARSSRSPTAPTTRAADAGRSLRPSPAASTCRSTSSSSSRRSTASGQSTVDDATAGRRHAGRARSAIWRAGPAARSSPPSGPRRSSQAARQIVTELRQQYSDCVRTGTRAGMAPD